MTTHHAVRLIVRGLSAMAVALALSRAPLAAGRPQYGSGADDTEIRIGNSMPYSGAMSLYGTMGRAEAAYFRMLNERGGINGRKIVFLSLDDAYSPPKTVEQTRRLVEQDQVLLIFSTFGTATNAAVQKYLNERGVPQLFPVSGASRWADPDRFPWTIGWQPTYRSEGRLFARYILDQKPGAKIGVLYQNDDYGKDYLEGLKEGLGAAAAARLARAVTYQATDPDIYSQIVTLAASGADVFVDVSTAKFAAQAIRKADEIGWRPLHLLNSISTSVASVLALAGLEKSAGIVSMQFAKDPTDPRFQGDPAVEEWLAWMKAYYPAGDRASTFNVSGYNRAMTLAHVLRQCGDDLTRDNVMRQAGRLDLQLPMLLPGVRATTGPARFTAIRGMQLKRFNGHSWEGLGPIVEAD